MHDTLNSFIGIRYGEMRPDGCILVEDGAVPLPAWLQTNINYYSANLDCITWVNNGTRQGQVNTIDRAYSLVTTDYVFHLEDDWHFNERDFMRESMEILQQYPEIIQVSLRGNTGWHELIDSPRYPFKMFMPYGNRLGRFVVKPGLRRMSEYRRIGGYGRHAACGTHGLVHEALLSRKYLDMGY